MVLDILPEGAQRPPRGYKLEAGGGNVGKRQKQARDHEKVNDDRLKRDGAALIRHERTFIARKRYRDGWLPTASRRR
jgi:hypothetical protein